MDNDIEKAIDHMIMTTEKMIDVFNEYENKFIFTHRDKYLHELERRLQIQSLEATIYNNTYDSNGEMLEPIYGEEDLPYESNPIHSPYVQAFENWKSRRYKEADKLLKIVQKKISSQEHINFAKLIPAESNELKMRLFLLHEFGALDGIIQKYSLKNGNTQLTTKLAKYVVQITGGSFENVRRVLSSMNSGDVTEKNHPLYTDENKQIFKEIMGKLQNEFE